jgi:catechol 2,3-dioxygenase-like lactoylglutathione lyase family enzyme
MDPLGAAVNLLVNIDVDDLEKASRFYCDALGLSVGRRFDGWLELIGAAAPIYLLPKAAGTPVSPRRSRRATTFDTGPPCTSTSWCPTSALRLSAR